MRTLFITFWAIFATTIGTQAKTRQMKCNADTLIQQLDTTPYYAIRTLDSVVVTGSHTIHYADRDVIRITRDMRKGARNTAQMLGNIPGIDCDYSNNGLTYYGSSKILILVDSIEKSAEYVKELHHLRFNKVDIVPNPSGKYADYDVLINLHTKPNYEGYEGNAFEHAEMIPTDGNGKGKNFSNNYTSASFTYTKNKWNLVGSYNFRYNQSEKDNAENTTVNHVNGLQETNLSPLSTHYFRIHNAYAALDYQFNKNHSISGSYNYSTDATDDYFRAGIERSWLEDDRRDTIVRKQESGVNSTRHTLGLYYRGRSGAWNYTYDFNYINDGWTYDRNMHQSTGFVSSTNQRNHMDYVWTKSEVNRRFFDGKYYVSAGYNFTWKDYSQKDRMTNCLLSENSYKRNEFWTWMSYHFNEDTDLNFSASAQHIHTESADYEDNNMMYKLSGMLYHRWNKWLWMRFNYSANVAYPQLDQVSNYGFFTDSLNWKGGNPALKTQIYHSCKLRADFFNMFNIQAGYNYSPNLFANITDVGEGVLPSGEYGRYITNMPQNTSYKEFWLYFYIYKRIGDWTLSTSVTYENKRAEYMSYKNSNDGFDGSFHAKYYNSKHQLALQVLYNLNNAYGVSAQGKSTQKHDFIALYIGKDLFKQRMNIGIQYISPKIFCKGYYENINRSVAMSSYEHINVNKNAAHSLMFNLTYRFQGGKSIRQYNRSMSGEN